MQTQSLYLALCASLLLLAPTRGDAQSQSPVIPTGDLSAYPEIVQAGTFPQLTWNVTLPQSVTDIVTITYPGTVTPKKDLTMKVRVLGASVKRVWTNRRGQVVDWEWVPTEARLSYDGGSYTQIFYDTHDDVNPNHIVTTMVVRKNRPINFGGRYRVDGSWSSLRTSTNTSHNVVALKDGDTPPTTTPLYQQPTIESFILPYLDEEGNINLGPRDVIYLMELTHTNRNDGGFDLQDLALLVTFED